MKITKYELIATIIIIILVLTLYKCERGQNKKLSEINSLYAASQDSLITYKNKYGQQVAQIEPLIATNQEYFLQLKSKDHEINDLQNLVKQESKKRRNVEVAMIIANNTVLKLKDSLKNVIVSQETEYHGDSVFIYPTYQRTIADQWITDSITLGRSIFKHSLLVRNKYNVVIGSEKSGLFKTKPFAKITSLSPYSETTSFRVYQKKEEPSKFWSFIKGGFAGAGIVWLIKAL